MHSSKNGNRLGAGAATHHSVHDSAVYMCARAVCARARAKARSAISLRQKQNGPEISVASIERIQLPHPPLPSSAVVSWYVYGGCMYVMTCCAACNPDNTSSTHARGVVKLLCTHQRLKLRDYTGQCRWTVLSWCDAL